MKLPKSDISTIMVRNAIGYPSTDLGTLCRAGEPYINKWSKCKPVTGRFENNRPSDWYLSSQYNCGINYLTHTTIAKLIESINNGVNQHPYTMPSGGVNSPFRLGDFAGYDTESIPPLTAGNAEGTYYKNHATFGVTCLIRMSDPDELLISDIFGTEVLNWYYAAALQKATDSSIMWMSLSKTISNDGLGMISIPLANLTGSTTYYLYQFLSTYSKPSFTSGEQVGRFVAIPGKQKQVIRIETADIYVSLINLKRSDAGLVTGSIRIENSSGSKTYRNVSVQFRYGNANPTDRLQVGESIVNLPDITVTSLERKEVPFQSGRNALPDFNRLGGKVILYMDNQLQAQGYILKEAPVNL